MQSSVCGAVSLNVDKKTFYELLYLAVQSITSGFVILFCDKRVNNISSALSLIVHIYLSHSFESYLRIDVTLIISLSN